MLKTPSRRKTFTSLHRIVYFLTNIYSTFDFMQQPGDEQMENETDEQFEERVLNKRAAQMFVSVRARLQKQDSIQLSDMTYRNNRKQVIWYFHSFLRQSLLSAT